MTRTHTVLARLTITAIGALSILPGGGAVAGQALPHIINISVCGDGPDTSPSCPAATFDTQQVVLAADAPGLQLNQWSVPNAVDEHSSIFPPNSLGTNPDYLFFVASGTTPLATSRLSTTFVHAPEDIGVVVLSGRGPDASGQWRLRFADGYGSLDESGNVGQVLLAPTGQNRCPADPTGPTDPADPPEIPDTTFDLNYAAPGSVVIDPTSPPGSLLMYYEGANACATPTVTVLGGIATSNDYGQHWPMYVPNSPNFLFAPLPYQNINQGPGLRAGAGAFGSAVCVDIGGICTPNLPNEGYGRYPVLSPPPGAAVRDTQPAAFVDDVHGGTPIYLYTVQDYDGPLPNGRPFDITIARAALNGGSGPLVFETWEGSKVGWVAPPPNVLVNDAAESPFLATADDPANCEQASQDRSSPSLSYVPETGEYLLTFVCKTGQSGAWYFSTNRDLSNPAGWTTPTEILGSSNAFSSTGFFNGWYPTFMSIGQPSGRLLSSGYVFYLWGCEGGDCGGRQFTSRAFHLQTSDNVYSRAPVTKIDGLASQVTHLPFQSFSFSSNEPGSALQCSFDGGAYLPCTSPDVFRLQEGSNRLFVKAISPFGTVGPPAKTTVTYEPIVTGTGSKQ